jgi:hypothetical protein
MFADMSWLRVLEHHAARRQAALELEGGADHFDRRDKAKLAKRLVARLHDLGFSVELRAA